MIREVMLIMYNGDPAANMVQINAESIYQYLIDDDYVLDSDFDLDEDFSVQGQSIDLSFIDNTVLQSRFTTQNLTRYVFGCEVYIDGVETPIFWGYVDPKTIDQDQDNQEWSFTVTDFMTVAHRFWDAEEHKAEYTFYNYATVPPEPFTFYSSTLPFHSTRQYAWTEHKDINWILEKLQARMGLGDVTVNLGLMRNNLYMFAEDVTLDGEVSYLNEPALFDHYLRFFMHTPQANCIDFIRELKKHYGAVIYFTPDKKLNFACPLYVGGNAINIDSLKMKSVSKPYMYEGYDYVLVNHFAHKNEAGLPKQLVSKFAEYNTWEYISDIIALRYANPEDNTGTQYHATAFLGLFNDFDSSVISDFTKGKKVLDLTNSFFGYEEFLLPIKFKIEDMRYFTRSAVLTGEFVVNYNSPYGYILFAPEQSLNDYWRNLRYLLKGGEGLDVHVYYLGFNRFQRVIVNDKLYIIMGMREHLNEGYTELTLREHSYA